MVLGQINLIIMGLVKDIKKVEITESQNKIDYSVFISHSDLETEAVKDMWRMPWTFLEPYWTSNDDKLK